MKRRKTIFPLLLVPVLIVYCLLTLSACPEPLETPEGPSVPDQGEVPDDPSIPDQGEVPDHSFIAESVSIPILSGYGHTVTGYLAQNGRRLATLQAEMSEGKTSALFSQSVDLAPGTYDLSCVLSVSANSNSPVVSFPLGSCSIQLSETESPAPGTLDVRKQAFIVSMPETGMLEDGRTIAIKAYPGNATIYYTCDKSDPTLDSRRYTGPISLTETTTLKAFAVADGYAPSGIRSGKYTKGDNDFSVGFPTRIGSVFIGTEDRQTFFAITVGEDGLGKKRYKWFYNGSQLSEGDDDRISVKQEPRKSFRLLVKVPKDSTDPSDSPFTCSSCSFSVPIFDDNAGGLDK